MTSGDRWAITTAAAWIAVNTLAFWLDRLPT